MAITIQGPDGASIDFPEGTSETEMSAAMAQAYPHPSDAAPSDPGFVANAARALRMGLPFGNQFVAGEKTLLPQSLGGSQGFNYGKNLADVNAADARLQQEHPAIADLGQGTGAAIGALAVPAAALGEGAQGFGLLGRATRSGMTGAGLGAVQGAGAPGSDIRNLPQTEEGAVGGAATGGALGAGFPVLGAGIGKAVSGRGAVDSARQALVDALKNVGIKPTAGQTTGNQGLQKLEASISDIPFGGGGAEPVRQANSAAFTKAILAKAGFPEVADASPESLNAAHEALGQQFDELGARNAIMPDPQLHADMDKAVNDYQNVTGTPAPGVNKVVDAIKGGQAPISVVQQMPPRSSGPAPTTMLDFLRRAGGLQDEGGDLASMGFSNLKGAAAKGSSKIIDKENGVPMDEGLRMAVESGYMEPHEEVSDLINKLGEHPTYSVHDAEAVAQRQARNDFQSGPGSGELGNEENYQPQKSGLPAPAPRVVLGEEYNNLRSQLGKTAQKLRFTDPAQAEAYRGVQDALDSAMERSIAANNPADIGAFQDVRRKYKNLVPIEQAAGSAGADAASGIISPQQMRTALAFGNNRRAYARGIGDLAPLTNAGNAILTNFPQSGTAPRTMMAHALQGIGGLVGGLGGAPGGIESAGLGAAAGGLALPALAGRAIMSGPGQATLARTLAKRLPTPPARPMSRAAMAAALGVNADLQAQRNQTTPQ